LNRRRAPAHPLLEIAAVAAAALLLTFIAFGPGLRAAFVSDDINAIVQNHWVTGPLDAAGIATHLSWWGEGRSDSPGYRPAATLSFALNRATSGSDPFGYRVVNFAMNALCAALLFALGGALGLRREAAAAAAAIFTVLPIHSEAVLWIVGRAELGAAAAFLLAALLCVIHRRRGGVWPVAAASAAVLLGMGFKENTVTVLAAPAIFHLACERSSLLARRDAMAVAGMAAAVAVYLLLRTAADGPAIVASTGSLLDNPLSLLAPATRLLGALAVFGRYLALSLWPAALSVDYSFDALGIGPGFVASTDTGVALAFLGACLWAGLRGPGRRDVVVAGLLLAAASFSIVSNTVFVLGTILGERLFYLPTAGLCLAVAALVDPVFRSPQRRRRSIVAAACVLLVAASIAVDRARASQWLTPTTLFEAAVRVQPRSARAHMELGTAYGYAGRIDDSMKQFEAALEIWPEYAAASFNQGNALARAQRYQEAIAAYRRSLAAEPKLVRAWHNLALSERILGDPAAWLEAMRGAVSVAGGSPSLNNELGEALLANGRYDEAIAVYDGLVATGEAVAASLFNRGVAHHHLGGCAAAVEDYRLASAAPAPAPEAVAAAAGCLRELGRSEEAASIEQAGKVANRGIRR